MQHFGDRIFLNKNKSTISICLIRVSSNDRRQVDSFLRLVYHMLVLKISLTWHWILFVSWSLFFNLTYFISLCWSFLFCRLFIEIFDRRLSWRLLIIPVLILKYYLRLFSWLAFLTIFSYLDCIVTFLFEYRQRHFFRVQQTVSSNIFIPNLEFQVFLLSKSQLNALFKADSFLVASLSSPWATTGWYQDKRFTISCNIVFLINIDLHFRQNEATTWSLLGINVQSDTTFLISWIRGKLYFVGPIRERIKGDMPSSSKLVFQDSFFPKCNYQFILFRISIDVILDDNTTTTLRFLDKIRLDRVISNNNFKHYVSTFTQLILHILDINHSQLTLSLFVLVSIFNRFLFCYDVDCLIVKQELTHHLILFVKYVHLLTSILISELFCVKLVTEYIATAFVPIHHTY